MTATSTFTQLLNSEKNQSFAQNLENLTVDQHGGGLVVAALMVMRSEAIGCHLHKPIRDRHDVLGKIVVIEGAVQVT